MKNITITLDAETAAWIRVHAAEKNMSVSRVVGEILSEKMGHRLEYEQAMRRYLSKGAFNLSGDSERYPTREELYDRGRLR
jgi:hypothetical protein